MKKKRYPLLPALAVAALMLIPIRGAAQVFNPYSVSYTATYSNDNLTIGTDTLDGVVYSTVSYNDLYNDGEPGMPSLPVDFLKFSVPYNATDFTVSVNTRMWHTQTLDHLLYPCQMPRLLDGSPAPPAMLPDSAAYYSGNYYPSQMAWVADEGFLAGENHIVTVAVLPFRYTHTASTNQLSMVRRCGITLRYRLSDSLAMQPIVRNDSLLREEGYNLVQTMVVNPNSVKSYAPTLNTSLIDSIGYMHGIGGDVINGGGYAGGDGPSPINPPLPPPGVDTTGIGTELYLDEINYNYPYLIVTTPELKHAVRRIAALKRQKGYNVKVVTMDEVLSSQLSGFGDVVGEGHNARLTYTDDAGKLRQFIRNYYKYFGTKYVLLAGSSIPYRLRCDTVKTYNVNTNELDTVIIDGISDFYYIELNSDWSQGKIEHKPDLYVGRILCDSTVDVKNYTDKLFRYELNPGNGDYSYLQKVFTQEGSEFDVPLQQFKKYIPYSIPIEIKISERFGIGFPTGKDLIDSLNRVNAGLVCIYNHGDTSRIRTYGPDSLNQMYFIKSISSHSAGNGLNCMNNRYYPTVFYSPTCTTVPFDNRAGVNMGKSFTIGKDYGGPVYIGNTRLILSGPASALAGKFAQMLKNGYHVLGMADALSVEEFIKNDRLNPFKQDVSLIHSYIGDPAVELFTGIPQQFSGINSLWTDNSLTITRTDSDSVVLSYLDTHNNYKSIIITTPSITLHDIAPHSAIMLYGNNHIPLILPLELQNCEINESQYIIANDVIAGNSIDCIRTDGNVTIMNHVVLEIEASGMVRLEDGFKVEKGATFAVYPSCF